MVFNISRQTDYGIALIDIVFLNYMLVHLEVRIYSHDQELGAACKLLLAYTVMILSFRTLKKFVVITLKFELCGSAVE